MSIVDRDPDRLVGTVLGGRFTVKECVAVDEAGSRYEAFDDEDVSAATVRVLHKVRPDDRSVKKLTELLTEVSELGVEGIAPLRAVGRTRANDVYYATAEIFGEPLSERLLDGSLRPAVAIRVISATAHILAKVHERGVVHGGLHPGAIILKDPINPREVQLADFGLGPLTSTGEALSLGDTSASTPYQSPEQASNDPYNQRADIYSLGALLFACLTGRPPFAGRSPLEILAHQLRGEAPALADIEPTLKGTPLQEVVNRSMQVRPEDRLQTMDAFLKALAKAGKGEAARRVSMPPPARRSTPAPEPKARETHKPPQKKAGPYRGEKKGASGRYVAESRSSLWPYVLGVSVIAVAITLLFTWETLVDRGFAVLMGGGAAPQETSDEQAEPPIDPPLEPSEAAPSPQKTVEPLTDRARKLITEGTEALRDKRYSVAVSRFRSAKRAAPYAPLVARGLGIAYAETGQGRKAAAELRRYLELEPAAADAHAIRARITSLE